MYKSVLLAGSLAAFALASCATQLSSHPVVAADIGAPASEAQIVESLQRPGVVGFEKVVVADWHFPNSVRAPGSAEWRARELEAQIYFYAIRHPEHGLYFIDAGMPASYETHMGPMLRRVVREDYDFALIEPTEDWVRDHGPPRGVFITHLHYDHVLGVVALDRSAPMYVGPGDGAHSNFFYRFITQPTREALAGRQLRAWRFAPPAGDELAAIDVFGDGSVFALHVPGHTPGATAYLVNAVDGPQLITGDAVHSREAWTGELEEATGFERDLPQIFASRAALERLASRIPDLAVHPGHQSLEAAR